MEKRRRLSAVVCSATLSVILSACALLGGQTLTTPAPPQAGGTAPGEVGEQPGEVGATITPTPFKTELVICALDDPDTLYGSADPVAAAILRLVSPPAAVYGDDYVAEPGSILSLPNTQDGTLNFDTDGSVSVRLHYRSDLAWSDGEPFEVVADPLLGLSLPASPYAPTFSVTDRQSGDVSVAVTAAPGAEYPFVPSQPPLPWHVFGDQLDAQALASEGYIRLMSPALGPYALSETRQEDQTITFSANPYYPGAESLIPLVRFRFIPDPSALVSELGSGGCDVILDGSLSAGQLPDLLVLQQNNLIRLHIHPGPVYERVIFNTYPDAFSGGIPFFADARVRQAFMYAADRATMAEQTFGSAASPFDSWIPPDHWAYPGPQALTVYPYDPATAASLLEQAGWVDLDGDGTREYHGQGGTYACQRGEWRIEEGTLLAPVLIVPADDLLRASLADHLKVDLAQVGVNLQVQPVNPADMFSAEGPLVRRTFDMALLSTAMRPDPGGISRWVGADVYRHPLDMTVVHRWDLEDRWLTSEQMVEILALDNTPGPHNDYQGQNYGGWCDEAANIAIVQANLTPDLDRRAEFYAQHQTIFTQEVPEMPLFARPRIAASALYLCGIRLGPFDPLTWNLEDWTFDESGACGE